MIELQNASQNNILPAAQLLSREKHNQNSNQNWISDRNLAQDSGSLIVSFFFSFFFSQAASHINGNCGACGVKAFCE